MTFFWILAGILTLLFLIGILSAHVVLEYREEVTLTLSVLFFRFRLFPARKKKVRLSDYSKKALEKKQRSAKKKKTKRQVSKQESKSESKGILERLKELRELLALLLERTLGHLSVRASHIRISVATGDAASTAILFGAVNGSVAVLLELLDRFGKLKRGPKDTVWVRPDYLAQTTTADICFVFSLRIWHLVNILVQAFFTYIKSKKQKTKS